MGHTNLCRRVISSSGAVLKRFSSQISTPSCDVKTPAVTCTYRCKLLIVGGGTGGCSVAWRLANKINKNDITVLEPDQYHYYQPSFPLVAAGIAKYQDSRRPMEAVLPRGVNLMKRKAVAFQPCRNSVLMDSGDRIEYEYMVVAVGLQSDFSQICGLKRALDDPTYSACTVYDKDNCCKAHCLLKHLKGGHAVFTFPVVPGKCPGAALKIMFLAEDKFRQTKRRDNINIVYNTGTEAIFGVPKYAPSLNELALKKKISVNCGLQLVEVTKEEAVFVNSSGQHVSFNYNFLHINPPMCPPRCLTDSSALTDGRGFLRLHPHTLRHLDYPNIFGIGDCTNTPNAKTAAAIGPQSSVVEKNLLAAMRDEELPAQYNGYGACPMITCYNKGRIMEFKYDKIPCETFPIDQTKDSRLMYYLIVRGMPRLYWNKLIKGKWDGPGRIQSKLNPGGCK